MTTARDKEKTGFEKLYEINVNEKTEKKEGLTYLSWAWAWAEFKKVHPTATYEIKKFDGGIPYAYDPNTGYMVYTSVTVDDLTHEMWLPVMDGHNKAMKSEPYTYDTKYKKGVRVEAATMFDVNKAIMRCLTKNLAMFGLGLYIYAGEDLPDVDEQPMSDDEKKAEIKRLLQETNSDTVKFLLSMSNHYKTEIKSVDDMNRVQLEYGLKKVREKAKGAK